LPFSIQNLFVSSALRSQGLLRRGSCGGALERGTVREGGRTERSTEDLSAMLSIDSTDCIEMNGSKIAFLQLSGEDQKEREGCGTWIENRGEFSRSSICLRRVRRGLRG
jgi:hypothetical protein